MTSFLLIDKPVGITSHDVIDAVRRITGERRVGHAGTLDPFASGLLIIAVSRDATKKLGEFVGLDKEYEVTMRLGATSTTEDPEGDIAENENVVLPSEQAVLHAMNMFIGEQNQTPPRHAAIKIHGRKLYEYARRGINVDVPPRKIKIYAFDLIEYSPPILRARVKCSSGTYIRSLARDLGKILGTGAYATELRRTKIGEYKVENAKTLKELTVANNS